MSQVRGLLEYTKARAERSAQRIELQPAVVIRVEAIGMGDRHVTFVFSCHIFPRSDCTS